MAKIFWLAMGLFVWFFVFLNMKGVRFQEVTSFVVWDFIVGTAMIPIILILLGFMVIIFKNSFKASGREYDRARGDYYDRDGGDGGGGG